MSKAEEFRAAFIDNNDRVYIPRAYNKMIEKIKQNVKDGINPSVFESKELFTSQYAKDKTIDRLRDDGFVLKVETYGGSKIWVYL